MSTDIKTLSEREAVMRERAAYREGFDRCCWRDPLTQETAEQRVESEIRARYPMPQRTRPRVVRDPHGAFDQGWSVRDGILGCTGYYPNGRWFPLTPCAMSKHLSAPTSIGHVTNERIKVWADLLANPFELVDDES